MIKIELREKDLALLKWSLHRLQHDAYFAHKSACLKGSTATDQKIKDIEEYIKDIEDLLSLLRNA